MNKENKKKAQQERAKAREKAEKKKKRNKLLKTWIPIVVVIIVVVIIIAAIVMSRSESTSGNFYEDGTEYGIIAEDGEDYEDDDDFDDDDDLWLDTAEGYVVEEGDTVNIDYTGYLDGEAFDGGSTDGAGTDITLGSSGYIDGFDDGVIGHEVGETFDIDVTFPDDYWEESLAGQPVVFTVTINGVYD